MRKPQTSNSNAKRAGGVVAALALSCTLAAAGCTTNLNPVDGDRGIGPRSPTSTPGTASGVVNVPMNSSYSAGSAAAIMANHAEYAPRVLGTVNPAPSSVAAKAAPPLNGQTSGQYANPAQRPAYISSSGTPVIIGDLAAEDVFAVPVGTTAGGATIVVGGDGTTAMLSAPATFAGTTTIANTTALNATNATAATPTPTVATSNLNAASAAASTPTPTMATSNLNAASAAAATPTPAMAASNFTVTPTVAAIANPTPTTAFVGTNVTPTAASSVGSVTPSSSMSGSALPVSASSTSSPALIGSSRPKSTTLIATSSALPASGAINSAAAMPSMVITPTTTSRVRAVSAGSMAAATSTSRVRVVSPAPAHPGRVRIVQSNGTVVVTNQ